MTEYRNSIEVVVHDTLINLGAYRSISKMNHPKVRE